MKRLIILVACAAALVSTNCLNREVDVTIKLTNPSNKTVPFKLEYTLPGGGKVEHRDRTPKEYIITLKKGESMHGSVYKDTLDILDVLHFQVLLDGEEKLVNDITLGLVQKLEFQVAAE